MKKTFFKLLRYSGIPFLFREILQKNKVTILMFHDISEETAEMSFSYLNQKYNIIDLNYYLEKCQNKNKIPKKSLIITFDDGHIGNYKMLPILEKYSIPITIFLCSGIINTNRNFWFKFPKLDQPSDEFKKISNIERLSELHKIGFEETMEYPVTQALTKNHINEMFKVVNFQSHTIFHPCLPQCNEKEAYHELYQSKKNLEKEFSFEINSIAYPNGDYSEKIVELTKKAGYKCGITVDYGFNTIDSDLFRLRRVSTNDTSDLNEFIVRVSGLWGFLKSIT